MGNWRTQVVLVLFALGWLPVGAQSLGDAARAERERQSRVPRHAPVLSDEDLSRDKILPDASRNADSVSRPADNAPIDDDLSLGEYARRLRQRQAAERASTREPAAKSTVKSESASSVVPHQRVAGVEQKTVSLGDVSRELPADRHATRHVRMRNRTTQSAAQDSNNAFRSRATRQAPQDSRPMPPASAAVKPTRPAAIRPAPNDAERHATQPAVLEPVAAASRLADSRTGQLSVLEPTAAQNGPQVSIRVPHGSSLWRLAREHLGAGHLWRELWKANPQIKDPNRIRAGELLHVPALRDREPTGSLNGADVSGDSAGISPADAAVVQGVPSMPSTATHASAPANFPQSLHRQR